VNFLFWRATAMACWAGGLIFFVPSASPAIGSLVCSVRPSGFCRRTSLRSQGLGPVDETRHCFYTMVLLGFTLVLALPPTRIGGQLRVDGRNKWRQLYMPAMQCCKGGMCKRDRIDTNAHILHHVLAICIANNCPRPDGGPDASIVTPDTGRPRSSTMTPVIHT
jgi:hypothetical protein